VDTSHTVSVDEIKGEYDLHHENSMIKVQLLLYGLDYGGDDETEAINNRILVYSIQKFTRMLILRCQGNKEYGRVEVDTDLGSQSIDSRL
jgi:hypothetical protein